MSKTSKQLQVHTIALINKALMDNGLEDIEYTVSKSTTGILIEYTDVFEMTSEEIRENDVTKDYMNHKK